MRALKWRAHKSTCSVILRQKCETQMGGIKSACWSFGSRCLFGGNQRPVIMEGACLYRGAKILFAVKFSDLFFSVQFLICFKHCVFLEPKLFSNFNSPLQMNTRAFQLMFLRKWNARWPLHFCKYSQLPLWAPRSGTKKSVLITGRCLYWVINLKVFF
jgi:hypothetical protein